MSDEDESTNKNDTKIKVNYAELTDIAHSYRALEEDIKELREEFEKIKGKTITTIAEEQSKSETKIQKPKPLTNKSKLNKPKITTNKRPKEKIRYSSFYKEQLKRTKSITRRNIIRNRKVLLRKRKAKYQQKYGFFWFLRPDISNEYASFRDTIV